MKGLVRTLPWLLCIAAGVAQAQAPVSTATMTWAEVKREPLPAPGLVLRYGRAPAQTAELRVPGGEGPFPVMVLVHGGCWLSAFDREYMTRLAAWFEQRGVATWTIEYRRLGEDGGGWPGTFADVAGATDHLRSIAKEHRLDMQRVYAAGHSAGGQLALWLAGRDKLARTSDLYRKKPLAIRGVLGLDAITDMAAYRVGPADSCHASVDKVLGGDPAQVPTRYADTSPRQRLPLGVPQVFVHGDRDGIVDPKLVRDYVAAAKQAGDRVEFIGLPDAGHFEAVVPSRSEDALAKAWSFLLEATR